MRRLKPFIFVFLILVACKDKSRAKDKSVADFESIRYAKSFGIAKTKDGQQLFYCNGTDTTWSFHAADFRKPNLRIVVLSSVFAGFMEALDRRELIVGVDKIKYFNDSMLISRFNSGLIVELGEEGQLNLESLIALKPDVLIGSSYIYNDKALLKRVEAAGTKVLYCDNFKEQDPLARAEWIKFFGLICNDYQKADSVFKSVETQYLQLREKYMNGDHKPLVMTDALYQDAWNVPGGNSYTAKIIEDAGGRYVFRDKTDFYTFPLNLESVLKAAAQADVWIHVNTFHSRDEMLDAEPRYKLFYPFASQRVFNYNKRENASGGNDFWETGVVRPDLVLKDLSIIFANDKNNYGNLYFYTWLN